MPRLRGLGRRKLAAGVLVAVAGVGLNASAAFAYDCFVVKRSDAGSVNAAHSGKWFAIPLLDAFQEPAPDGFGMCPAQAQAAVAALADAGYPTVLTTRSDRILLEGTGADRQGKTGDGKGIEHFEDSPYVGELLNVAFTAAAQVDCT